MPSEEIMQQWDHWRKRIADGCTNSSPRDWFENEIDDRDERIAALERACNIALDAYNRVSNIGLPGDVAGHLVHARQTLKSALFETTENQGTFAGSALQQE